MDPPLYDNSIQSVSATDQTVSNSFVEQSETWKPVPPSNDLQLPTTSIENASYVTPLTKPEFFAAQAAPHFQTFPQNQQQQATFVYVNAMNQPPVVQQQIIESYAGAQTFACFVLWCCNLPFGLIAWILAFSADNIKFKNREEARRLGKASVAVSTSGVIVSVIVVIVIIVINASSSRSYYRRY